MNGSSCRGDRDLFALVLHRKSVSLLRSSSHRLGIIVPSTEVEIEPNSYLASKLGSQVWNFEM